MSDALPSKIEKASKEVAETPWRLRPRPLVPYLKETFGMTTAEACEALRQADLIRARAT